MALVIEATPEPGPLGLPGLSVAHYGEQNGDLMRDPEMCFELGMAVRSAHLTAVLLPQRLRRRRAVVALHPSRALVRLSRELHRAA